MFVSDINTAEELVLNVAGAVTNISFYRDDANVLYHVRSQRYRWCLGEGVSLFVCRLLLAYVRIL